MWPWGHLAVGYLLYSALVRGWFGRRPTGYEALLVAFGTQFPDLIDKPLAWTFAILPSGRSLAHSLFTAIPVALLVLLYFERDQRPTLGVAFGLGYLSHVFVDALPALVNGEFRYVTYLGWPLLPTPPYEMDSSFLEHFVNVEPTSYFLFQLMLTAIAFGVWLADGHPGVATLFEWQRRLRERA